MTLTADWPMLLGFYDRPAVAGRAALAFTCCTPAAAGRLEIGLELMLLDVGINDKVSVQIRVLASLALAAQKELSQSQR